METILVFDGNSILNRAFYGVRPLTAPDGMPTNAIFGFVNILLKNVETVSPTAVAVAFDLPAPTFRHKACETYKANRKGMPEELAVQLPVAKEICAHLGYTVVTCEGYEADDLLGTIAAAAERDGDDCVLVTGDRDSFQLVSPHVKVCLAANNETKVYDSARIADEYGVSPAQLVDVKAIMGDTSDNIKGVSGIGEKGALSLIAKYGSLDGVYANLDSEKGALKTKLENGKESAYQSYFLAKICTEAPIPASAAAYRLRERDDAGLLQILERLGFRQLVSRLWPEGPPAVKAKPAVPAEAETAGADTLLALPPEEALGVLQTVR